MEQAFRGRVLRPETKLATTLLSSRFLVSAKCLFNIVMRGYYYDAWIVLRSLQENFFHYLCFEESNNYAKRWFKKPKDKNRLRLREVKEVIKVSSNPHVKEAYSFMSDFVHSNMNAISRNMVKFYLDDPNRRRPVDSPEFRRDSDLLLKTFGALNTAMLLVLIRTFQEDLGTETRAGVTTFVMEERRKLGL
jgi:hypothetical protein